MDWLLSGLAFLILLTLLVLVHECGHFLVARLTRVTVEEFGFGLPPRVRGLFTWKKTLFSLNWIPFGGFVRLQGENSIDPDERKRQGSFAAASIPARIGILVAGVTMNLLIALLLFTMGFWFWQWVPTYLNADALRASEARGEVQVEWALSISNVLPDTPAMTAGVRRGDILVAIDHERVHDAEKVLALQQGKKQVMYTLLSGGDALTTSEDEYTEERDVMVSLVDGKAGVELSVFALTLTGSADRSFFAGLLLAFRETWTVMTGTIEGVGRLINSLVMEPGDIAGIVGIAQLTHTSVQLGFMKYLRLVALLSLSLAVLNILPFPALDGGRLLFVFYELVARKPVNRRFEVVTNGVGIALIMILMIAVTWNDVLRIVAS
jgi:regulator of sigma E protease